MADPTPAPLPAAIQRALDRVLIVLAPHLTPSIGLALNELCEALNVEARRAPLVHAQEPDICGTCHHDRKWHGEIDVGACSFQLSQNRGDECECAEFIPHASSRCPACGIATSHSHTTIAASPPVAQQNSVWQDGGQGYRILFSGPDADGDVMAAIEGLPFGNQSGFGPTREDALCHLACALAACGEVLTTELGAPPVAGAPSGASPAAPDESQVRAFTAAYYANAFGDLKCAYGHDTCLDDTPVRAGLAAALSLSGSAAT